MDHLFMVCEVVRCYWFGSQLGLCVEEETRFHDFMQQFLTEADEELIAELQRLIYSIW